ncbi:MAG TPA: hypothetical protein VJX68_06355 [Candidatus Binatus sp.]|nr:hypothetical protein [Candidatus Binatus sp.]
MATDTQSLREVYRELVALHLEMRQTLDRTLKIFRQGYRGCRPEDEATLARQFRAIIEATRANIAAGAGMAAERLSILDE